MAEFGGLGQEPRRFLAVGRAAAPGHLEHGQREHRLAVAARGGELVPFRGLLIVVGNAQSVGVELAQQRHGLGIGFLLDPPRRFPESRDIVAALVFRVGNIRLARRLRRWRWPTGPAAPRRTGDQRGQNRDDERLPFMLPSPVRRAAARPRRERPRRRADRPRCRRRPRRNRRPRRQRADLLRAGGKSDAGNREQLRPPFDALDDRLERRAPAARLRLAEHHVVRAAFAGGHGVVAALQAAAAGDARGLEAFDRRQERLDARSGARRRRRRGPRSRPGRRAPARRPCPARSGPAS